jgi:hypothetical protein
MDFELRSHSALLEVLGDPPPSELTDARLQVHWACQLVAAVARQHLPAEPDDRHTLLGWDQRDGLLLGKFTATTRPFQVALRPADLTLMLRVSGGATVAWFALPRRTLDQARRWLSEEIRDFTGDASLPDLEVTGAGLPPHPVHGQGAPFSLQPGAAFQELSQWFSAADATVNMVASTVRGASQVRCSPRTLEISTQVKLEGEPECPPAGSVGVGLSLGDEKHGEPYFFLKPSPLPEGAQLPALPEGGVWHRNDWTGAILPGAAIVEVAHENDRADRVAEFFRSGMAACRELLEGTG